MLEFRVVGLLRFTNGVEKIDYDNWGSCDKISIETIIKLADIYNIKYQDWYLEYREV